jgi:hypothetical protein
MSKRVDVFKIWPSLGEMAAAMGDKPDTVRKWRAAGRIPEDAWDRLIGAAHSAGRRITAQQIYEFNAPMRRRGKGADTVRPSSSRTSERLHRTA